MEWRAISNYLYSYIGRIWIIYKDPIKINVLYTDLQSISVQVFLEDGLSFFFSLYMLQMILWSVGLSRIF